MKYKDYGQVKGNIFDTWHAFTIPFYDYCISAWPNKEWKDPTYTPDRKWFNSQLKKQKHGWMDIWVCKDSQLEGDIARICRGSHWGIRSDFDNCCWHILTEKSGVDTYFRLKYSQKG